MLDKSDKMNERFELLKALRVSKIEIDNQIRFLSCVRRENGFGKKLLPIIQRFDAAFKSIPKTIPFTGGQPPIPLHEFARKLRDKVDQRKDDLFNRYSKELLQLHNRYRNLIQQIQDRAVCFCDDSQHIEQRFKRQAALRKQSYLDSLRSLHSESVALEISVVNNDQLQEGERSLALKFEPQLKAIRQKIEHVREQIRDQQQIEDPGLDVVEAKHREQMEFLREQNESGLRLFQQQKLAVLANIEATRERIQWLQRSSEIVERNFRDQIRNIRRDQIGRVDQDQIDSLKDRISRMIEELNEAGQELTEERFEAQIQSEIGHRASAVQEITQKKETQFQEIIQSKQQILKQIKVDITELRRYITEETRRKANEHQTRVRQLQDGFRKELDRIEGEFDRLYSETLSKASSETLRRLIRMQIELFRKEKQLCDHLAFSNALIAVMEEEFEQETLWRQKFCRQELDLSGKLVECELLNELVEGCVEESVRKKIGEALGKVKQIQQNREAVHGRQWICDDLVDRVLKSSQNLDAGFIKYSEELREILGRDVQRKRSELSQIEQDLTLQFYDERMTRDREFEEWRTILQLCSEIRELEMDGSTYHPTRNRKVPLPPLKV
jgi:hypothetical protein